MPRLDGILPIFVAVLLGASASAQWAQQDAGTRQFVAVFERSCLRYAGDAQGVRNWITSHGQQRFSSTLTQDLLQGRPGETFGASDPLGRRVLVSFDNGACEVVAMTGDYLAANRELLRVTQNLGVSTRQVSERTAPDGRAQIVYGASLGQRSWTLSVTKRPHSDAPALPPEIHLMATNHVNP